jgi:hypothetical protein
VSAGIFASGELREHLPHSRAGKAAAAIRWTIPWLLTIVAASAISGVVTSTLWLEHEVSTISAVAVESRDEPIDWSLVQERDPRLHP